MRAAIATTLRSVERDGDEGAVDAFLAAARTEWWAGPHHDFCHRIGISSWEGLWLGEPSDGWPLGFEGWLRGYQAQPWETTALVDRFVAERTARCAPFAGADEALGQLAERADLWLVTNGDSRLQRRKLVGAGLADRFHRVFVSGDIGSRKPETAFFDWVVGSAAVDGRTIVASVGDNIDNDIRPAIDRGWTPVAVRSGEPLPADLGDLDVAVVATLADVPPVLDRVLATEPDGRCRGSGVPE
jgi:FMN phosphatase YigB (HAD superfamily)